MHETVIIAGRGESVYTFDWTSYDCDIMVVSSGVFALKGKPVKHFVSLDLPRHFQEPTSKVDIAWSNDTNANHWPFWDDPKLIKHVSRVAAKRGHFRPGIPEKYLEQIPEHDAECIRKVFEDDPGLCGWQNGWLDYENTKPWDVEPQQPPSFKDGPVGLWSQAAEDAGFDAVRHSMLFAVQVAARLGYTRHLFIGCDLHGHRFPVQRATMQEWMPLAAAAGIEWVNLSMSSALAEFMPTERRVAA